MPPPLTPPHRPTPLPAALRLPMLRLMPTPVPLFDDPAVSATGVLDDSGVMLDAVVTRLRRSVDTAGAVLRTVPDRDGLATAPGPALAQLQHTVLECAQALAQWQAVFVPELARLRQAEQALQRTLAALSRA